MSKSTANSWGLAPAAWGVIVSFTGVEGVTCSVEDTVGWWPGEHMRPPGIERKLLTGWGVKLPFHSCWGTGNWDPSGGRTLVSFSD